MGRFYLKKIMSTTSALIINIDYTINSDGNLVFTEKYHQKRGYCCKSGCLHCPFGYNKVDPNVPAEFQSNWTENALDEDEEE